MSEESNRDPIDAERIQAFAGDHALEATPFERLYHGSHRLKPETVWDDGLPARGDDVDLISHINGSKNTAFRGTTKMPVTPDSDAGAAIWADVDGHVFQIVRTHGFDIEQQLQGRIPDGKGQMRDPLMKELEVTISAKVPAENIRKIGVVYLNHNSKHRVRWLKRERS